MSDKLSKPAPRCYRLNSLQVFYLTVQPVLLVVAAWFQWQANPEASRLFWTETLGQTPAFSALVLLAINFALLIGGCLLLNFLEATYWRGKTWLRALLQGVLFFGCLYLFYLPALFTVVIGPSTLNIQRALLAP